MKAFLIDNHKIKDLLIKIGRNRAWGIIVMQQPPPNANSCIPCPPTELSELLRCSRMVFSSFISTKIKEVNREQPADEKDELPTTRQAR